MACSRLAVRSNGMHWIGCEFTEMACIGLVVRSNGMHWIGWRSNGMQQIGCENKWHVLDHNEGLRIIKATFENDNHIQTRSYVLPWYFLPSAMFPNIRWFPCGFTEEKETVKERVHFN